MKLRLNLSTTPHPNKRPFIAGAVAAGTVSLIALLFLSTAAYRLWRSNRELHGDISHWQGEIRASRQKQSELDRYFKSPQAQQVLDRSAFLNSLIDERSFPWTKVFMDLEKTLPAGVRVVNISPKLKDGRAEVKLTFGAVNDECKLKFLKALEQSKSFSDIQVESVKYQEQTQFQSQDKILVDLTARYVTS
jgi:Tfp pilus assembly protein PilN